LGVNSHSRALAVEAIRSATAPSCSFDVHPDLVVGEPDDLIHLDWTPFSKPKL
jgi:hypothetical protein